MSVWLVEVAKDANVADIMSKMVSKDAGVEFYKVDNFQFAIVTNWEKGDIEKLAGVRFVSESKKSPARLFCEMDGAGTAATLGPVPQVVAGVVGYPKGKGKDASEKFNIKSALDRGGLRTMVSQDLQDLQSWLESGSAKVDSEEERSTAIANVAAELRHRSRMGETLNKGNEQTAGSVGLEEDEPEQDTITPRQALEIVSMVADAVLAGMPEGDEPATGELAKDAIETAIEGEEEPAEEEPAEEEPVEDPTEEDESLGEARSSGDAARRGPLKGMVGHYDFTFDSPAVADQAYHLLKNRGLWAMRLGRQVRVGGNYEEAAREYLKVDGLLPKGEDTDAALDEAETDRLIGWADDKAEWLMREFSVDDDSFEKVFNWLIDNAEPSMSDAELTMAFKKGFLGEAKWSKNVKKKWSPPEGFFKRSAEEIAKGLMRSSKDRRQAMSRLNFYINRGGASISKSDREKLEAAKKVLSAKSESQDNLTRRALRKLSEGSQKTFKVENVLDAQKAICDQIYEKDPDAQFDPERGAEAFHVVTSMTEEELKQIPGVLNASEFIAKEGGERPFDEEVRGVGSLSVRAGFKNPEIGEKVQSVLDEILGWTSGLLATEMIEEEPERLKNIIDDDLATKAAAGDAVAEATQAISVVQKMAWENAGIADPRTEGGFLVMDMPGEGELKGLGPLLGVDSPYQMKIELDTGALTVQGKVYPLDQWTKGYASLLKDLVLKQVKELAPEGMSGV